MDKPNNAEMLIGSERHLHVGGSLDGSDFRVQSSMLPQVSLPSLSSTVSFGLRLQKLPAMTRTLVTKKKKKNKKLTRPVYDSDSEVSSVPSRGSLVHQPGSPSAVPGISPQNSSLVIKTIKSKQNSKALIWQQNFIQNTRDAPKISS